MHLSCQNYPFSVDWFIYDEKKPSYIFKALEKGMNKFGTEFLL